MLVSPFGDMLKAFRKRKRISQRALAEQLGVHHNTIWSWEQGNYLPERKSLVLELGRLLGLSEAETRQLLEASLTVLSPHWSVPYQRNVFFTGRDTVLDQLHLLLHTDHAVALTQSYALYGLGGIGKTQIALEYAYRYALEYSAVFWIEGETLESILASLGRIAEHLQLPEHGDSDQQRTVTAVQHWLTTNGSWLLIWDNVEDPELLHSLLPPARQGAILITTRRSSLGTLAHSLELSPMTLAEGAAFVLHRAHLNKEIRPDESKSPSSEWEIAQELVKVMGGLPLALDQAGAYIEESGCNLRDYLQRYQQQRTPLLGRRGIAGRDHPYPVTTTFRLAYEQVRQQHSLAASLLCLCAFLAPEGIPEEIFLAGTASSQGTADPFITDLYELDQAIAALRNFSLVQRQPEAHMLSLHRLVQVTLQEGMSERERMHWQQRVVHLLNAVFPAVTSDTGTEIWQPCERLLPHVMTCAAVLPTCLQNQEFAELLLKAADYLDQRSQYERAKALYQQALQIQIQLCGLKHPNVARVQSKLAYLYRLLGHYAQAEPLFQQALHVLEQALGPDHPEVAYPLEGLAMVYYEQGRYELAEPLQQRALRIREQARGLEHLEVALSLNRLGNVYYEQGKYELAEDVYQRALQIRERAWGPEHFRLAAPLSNLGNLYRERGKYALAESLFSAGCAHRRTGLRPGPSRCSLYACEPGRSLPRVGRFNAGRGVVSALPYYRRAGAWAGALPRRGASAWSGAALPGTGPVCTGRGPVPARLVDPRTASWPGSSADSPDATRSGSLSAVPGQDERGFCSGPTCPSDPLALSGRHPPENACLTRTCCSVGRSARHYAAWGTLSSPLSCRGRRYIVLWLRLYYTGSAI